MSTHKFQIIQSISSFLPSGTAEYVAQLLLDYEVIFTISKPRKTKLGDYKTPVHSENHKISVNGNLNKYAFLLTTIHELAHLTTFEKFGNRVASHGVEWKLEFRRLFNPLLEREIFPDDIRLAVENYLKNAKASSHSDDRLHRVMRRYDKKRDILVEELEIGQKFKLNGRIFVKGKKLRKYHLCKEWSTGRQFKVLGLAEIENLENE